MAAGALVGADRFDERRAQLRRVRRHAREVRRLGSANGSQRSTRTLSNATAHRGRAALANVVGRSVACLFVCWLVCLFVCLAARSLHALRSAAQRSTRCDARERSVRAALCVLFVPVLRRLFALGGWDGTLENKTPTPRPPHANLTKTTRRPRSAHADAEHARAHARLQTRRVVPRTGGTTRPIRRRVRAPGCPVSCIQACGAASHAARGRLC